MTTTGLPATARAAVAAIALALAAGTAVLAGPGAAHADTVRDYQKWYFDALRMDRAHQITKGRGVTVAVVDSGVDAGHPDLSGQVLAGVGLGGGAPADGRGDPDRKKGHGTAMAGIIAGRGGGDMQVRGIAPEAKILPVALGENHTNVDSANGIRWAVDHGADVINLSIGAGVPTDVEQAAVRYAIERNVVLVAAVGNREQGDAKVISPASIPGVIAVTALTKSGGVWSGAASGPEVVLAAPADTIIAPAPRGVSRNGYATSTGTSDATAIASGVAALVRARYPDLDAANVVNRLIRTADDRGPRGRDPEFGFGAVDPVAALTANVAPVAANPLLTASASGPTPSARADDDPAVSLEIKDKRLALVQGGVCVAVAVLLVTLLVIGIRGSRRRRPPSQPTYPPPGGGSYPPR